MEFVIIVLKDVLLSLVYLLYFTFLVRLYNMVL
jgi:hypothetical protein